MTWTGSSRSPATAGSGFHKDDNIRHNEVERQAVVDNSAQLFSVNANIGADEAARRYLANLAEIEAAAAYPGPFMFGVRPTGLDRLL